MNALQTIDDVLTAAIARVQSLRTGEDGQTLAEYGLIISVVAVGVVVPSMLLFRGALASAFGSATDCINRVTC
ncbi:MAG: hypothetical protein WD939_00805 [Dehalococcoidia bacterium]